MEVLIWEVGLIFISQIYSYNKKVRFLRLTLSRTNFISKNWKLWRKLEKQSSTTCIIINHQVLMVLQLQYSNGTLCGSSKDSNNYRDIARMSCSGKLFVNIRIYARAEKKNSIWQGGFRRRMGSDTQWIGILVPVFHQLTKTLKGRTCSCLLISRKPMIWRIINCSGKS